MSTGTVNVPEPEQEPSVLDEQEDEGSAAAKPWDPTKIRITTKTFTLREIGAQLKEDELDLAPDFQRDFVWKLRQRTRLIESILLGIPLPAFYFNQELDGSFQVVDGVQRLSTLKLFLGNNMKLDTEELEYLKGVGGQTFEELDQGLRRRFNTTQIVAHIIEPQTPDEVKYDIFSRVNTLGSPLSAQEIRHAMSKERSRSFLTSLVERDSFDSATWGHFWARGPGGDWVRHNDRMANRELALRFCAFRTCTLDEYRQYDRLDSFLLDFTRRLDGRSPDVRIEDSAMQELQDAFERAMANCHLVLGKAAFRRWPLGSKRRGPINRALFEAQALALADYGPDVLEPKKHELVERLRGAFDDPAYLTAVTVSTGGTERVRLRLERTAAIVREVVG